MRFRQLKHGDEEMTALTRAQLRPAGSSAFAGLRSWLIGAALSIAALALTACGGGGSDGVAPPPGNTPPPTTPPPAVAPTRNEAARFLTQATFGPAPADVDRVVALGYAAWLDEQFNSQASTHLPAVPAFGDTLYAAVLRPVSNFFRRSGPRPRSRPISCDSVRCIRCRSCSSYR